MEITDTPSDWLSTVGITGVLPGSWSYPSSVALLSWGPVYLRMSRARARSNGAAEPRGPEETPPLNLGLSQPRLSCWFLCPRGPKPLPPSAVPFLLAPPEFPAGGHVSGPEKMVGWLSGCEPVGSPWPFQNGVLLLAHGLPFPGSGHPSCLTKASFFQSIPPCLSCLSILHVT